MLAKLEHRLGALTESALAKTSHVLFVLPQSKNLPNSISGIAALSASLSRRKMKPEELGKTPLSANLPHGGLAAWVMLDPKPSVFDQQTAMRKALQLLLDENPQVVAISLHPQTKPEAAKLAVYCAWINGVKLPERKKESKGQALEKIVLYGGRNKN